MKSYTVLCIVLSCTVLALADINEIRNNATKNVESQFRIILVLANETLAEVTKREGSISVIKEQTASFARTIHENNAREIGQHGRLTFLRASFVEMTRNIWLCIQGFIKTANIDNDRTLHQLFLFPADKYEENLKKEQIRLIQTWKDNYHKAMGLYADFYKNTVKEIQNSKSESTINYTALQFFKMSIEMSNLITPILSRVNEFHTRALTVLEGYAMHFGNASRIIIENAKGMRGCVPSVSIF